MTDTTKAAALAAAVARLTDAIKVFQWAPSVGPVATEMDWRDWRHDACDPDTIRTLLDGIATQAARIAELEANGVHSCHPECTRPVCVLQRRVAELEAERAGLVAAERERCAQLCEFWDATHPKRLAEEIRRVGAA
jgi:hypothetical protein